jgi:hypothetical protein
METSKTLRIAGRTVTLPDEMFSLDPRDVWTFRSADVLTSRCYGFIVDFMTRLHGSAVPASVHEPFALVLSTIADHETWGLAFLVERSRYTGCDTLNSAYSYFVETRQYGAKLSNVSSNLKTWDNDAIRFRGRFHVMLTGRRNYAKLFRCINELEEPWQTALYDVSPVILELACSPSLFDPMSSSYSAPYLREKLDHLVSDERASLTLSIVFLLMATGFLDSARPYAEWSLNQLHLQGFPRTVVQLTKTAQMAMGYDAPAHTMYQNRLVEKVVNMMLATKIVPS